MAQGACLRWFGHSVILTSLPNLTCRGGSPPRLDFPPPTFPGGLAFFKTTSPFPFRFTKITTWQFFAKSLIVLVRMTGLAFSFDQQVVEESCLRARRISGHDRQMMPRAGSWSYASPPIIPCKAEGFSQGKSMKLATIPNLHRRSRGP